MDTILGAGGSISNELIKVLAERGRPIRLVNRRGSANPTAAEAVAADLTDKEQTLHAVAESDVVYLLAGLPYDHRIWAEAWPRIMTNAIEACKRAGARLVFFDNVYMYGRVHGKMTEETPFCPISKKGEVRAQIATTLIDAWKAGDLTAMIARAADFYGPGAKNGLPNVLVFDPLSRGHKATCLADDSLPHSYTYTPDAAQALLTLTESESAWNQTWHVPTAPNPLTGKAFIERAAGELGVTAKYRVVGPLMVRLGGWLNSQLGEVREMLYQNDSPYLFDSSKYAKAFGFEGISYADGIRVTAESYR